MRERSHHAFAAKGVNGESIFDDTLLERDGTFSLLQKGKVGIAVNSTQLHGITLQRAKKSPRLAEDLKISHTMYAA